MNKPIEPPKCINCDVKMVLDSADEKMLTFICPTEDCNEMWDILMIFVDREDPILKTIPTYKKML